MLNDDMGNVIADSEEITIQEAKVAQARGELYDTYYKKFGMPNSLIKNHQGQILHLAPLY